MSSSAESEQGEPEVPKALPLQHRSCFSAAEIYKLREGGFLSPSVSRRLIENLTVGCVVCWQAIDEARNQPFGDVLGTESLEIRMLWSLTVYPEKSRNATHRQALKRARSEPLGVFRLLVEEVLELSQMRCPELVIGCGNYVRSLLSESPPDEPVAHRIWHDLHADLHSTAAKAWAQMGEHDNAALAAGKASLFCAAGLAFAPGELKRSDAEVNLRVAQGNCGFYRKEPADVWGAAFENALCLLQSKCAEPQRMEVLSEFACRLVEARLPTLTLDSAGSSVALTDKAHRLLLEAACLGAKHGQDYPILWLAVLHNLYRLEWWMAEESLKQSPRFGLLFNLAMVHHNLAGPLYSEWGNPVMRKQARAVGTVMVLESKRWSSSSGLQDAWRQLEGTERFDPLRGFELLGLAMVVGDQDFVEEHFSTVRAALADNSEALELLAEFHEDLVVFGDHVDQPAGESVILPWLDVMEKVYP